MARLAGAKARIDRSGAVPVPVRCPNGPGPCVATIERPGISPRVHLATAAGDVERVRVRIAGAEPGGRARLRLTSLLGPGVDVVKRRSLAIRER